MYEPTQREVDRNIEQSMAMFKRAQVGEVPALDPRKPKRVLLALDGSAQDELGVGIVAKLQARLSCEVAVVDGRRGDPAFETDSTTDWSQQLNAEKVAVDDAEVQDMILAAIDSWQADLLVVPCPFGRPFESIGADSTGTVIDVLRARSPVPVIATRAPFDPQGDVFSRLRMVLFSENEAALLTARWAVGLLHPQGELELVLIVEEEFYENVREAMHSIKPDVEISIESLENALTQTHARLHVALHRAAKAQGFRYTLNVRREGETQPLEVQNPAKTPPLLVLAHERGDNASQGHISNHIRRSPNPVLIVHSS